MITRLRSPAGLTSPGAEKEARCSAGSPPRCKQSAYARVVMSSVISCVRGGRGPSASASARGWSLADVPATGPEAIPAQVEGIWEDQACDDAGSAALLFHHARATGSSRSCWPWTIPGKHRGDRSTASRWRPSSSSTPPACPGRPVRFTGRCCTPTCGVASPPPLL